MTKARRLGVGEGVIKAEGREKGMDKTKGRGRATLRGKGSRRARQRRHERGREHNHTHTRYNEDSKEERPPKWNGWTRRVKISSDFFGSLLHILIKSIIHFRQKTKLPSILPGKWRLAKWLVYHGNLAPPFLLNLKKSCQEIPGKLAHYGIGVKVGKYDPGRLEARKVILKLPFFQLSILYSICICPCSCSYLGHYDPCV
jgi:hypothetical protein